MVQQKQGRVPATTRFDGVAINDDRGLEHEADAKGAAAARLGARPFKFLAPRNVSSVPWVTQRVRDAGGAVVQRRITIGGEAYTHASRRVNTLFDEVVTPALEKEGYKLYGIKSQLVEFIRQYREAPRAFADGGEFPRAFFPWLGDRVRPTRGSTTPVLKKFDAPCMSSTCSSSTIIITNRCSAADRAGMGLARLGAMQVREILIVFTNPGGLFKI